MIWRVLFAFICLSAASAKVEARPATSSFMEMGGVAPPPEAFDIEQAGFRHYDWSLVFRPQIANSYSRGTGGDLLEVSEPLWRKIEQINQALNSKPVRYIGPQGNCTEYVRVKREALRALNIPDSALSAAVVATSDGMVHAVLVLSTSQGEYVLDNLSSFIEPWSKTNYQWIKREGPVTAADGPRRWLWLANARIASR